jgi:archaellum component FlaG (FlaF/FlaG flagellin family)
MTIIKDAAGTGRGLRINAENRADVESISRSISQHINEIYQKHYSLVFEAIDPVGADDYFFYFKNTGSKNIHFTKFRFKTTVVGTVEIHAVTGTPSYTADTDIVPANRYVGSSAAITAVAKTDTNTTGLTNAATLIRQTLSTANTDFVDDVPAHIIVPPGQAIACLWDTATGILAGTVDIYEDQGVT